MEQRYSLVIVAEGAAVETPQKFVAFRVVVGQKMRIWPNLERRLAFWSRIYRSDEVMDANENLANFMAFTGADANAAQFHLDAAGGNLEVAVANFLDGGMGGGGGGGGDFGGGGGSGEVGGGFDAMMGDSMDAATSRDAELAVATSGSPDGRMLKICTRSP